MKNAVRRILIVMPTLAGLLISAFVSAENVTIENGRYRAAYDAQTQRFALSRAGDAAPFLDDGRLIEPGERAESLQIDDPIWGRGQALVVSSEKAETSILLFESAPFVMLQTTLHQTGNGVIDSVTPYRYRLRSDTPVSQLRSYGTAGLKNVEASSNPGSYAFLGVVNPKDRSGVISAWLTGERGSGLVFSGVDGDGALIQARLDYGGVQSKTDEELETFLIGDFDDARLGLEAYADAMARRFDIHLPPQPTVYCTWYHARASNHADLLDNARFAKENLAPYGFSVIQIDDGWQLGKSDNGPDKNFTGHNPDGPYPDGMQPTAEAIHDLGLTPGLWFMPFAGTADDPFFAGKQNFFATEDGKPFEVNWGGTCFDLTRPEVREYVASTTRRITREWGFKYLKLDGLWTGMAADICYVNTGFKNDRFGAARLHDAAMSRVEAYRAGMKTVRDAAGPDVFILGCNLAQNMRTLSASIGLFDAMRIGPDNGRNWDSMKRGPFSGSNLYFLHGRVWYNDPDPIYVRDNVPLDHARALASWDALTGQLNASSTQYDELSPARLSLLRRTMPAHGLLPRPADLFDETIPRIWLLTDEKNGVRRDVVGLFNWDEKKSVTIHESASRIGLPKADRYAAFDYWGDCFIDPFGGEVGADLPPASCRILAIRPVSPEPAVLGTSRHITQGAIDLIEERWDETKKTLSGVSRVVGGDPYELRIAAGVESGGWKAVEASAADDERDAGVLMRIVSQNEWRVRVAIDSPVNREVHWTIRFTAE